jgi:ribosomal protein L37AE/L43A
MSDIARGRTCANCGKRMTHVGNGIWTCVCGNVVNEYKKPPFRDESERDKRYG